MRSGRVLQTWPLLLALSACSAEKGMFQGATCELGWSSANARAASGQQDDLLASFILHLCRLDSVRYQQSHGVAAMNSKIVRLTDICFVLPDPESLFKDQPDDSTVLTSSKVVTQFSEKHRLQQSTFRGAFRSISSIKE